MVFNSFQYFLFFPIVLGAYWLIRRRRPQNALLLVASYFFYASWDIRFLPLMWLSTIVDYIVGRALSSVTNERHRKMLFALSLVINLGVLGFFKYYDFFIESATELLRQLGLGANEPVLRILLPVGISFYTFHGISYTFDVYRRHIEPARSFLDFACFVAYFPQLVAGPIGRAHIQLPQFEHARRPPDWEKVRSGCFLILLGLFKKIAIADVLAPIVNKTFATERTASALTLIFGAYAFALQIYGDFAGYSDVARGSSRLLGIELPRNFEQPYLSRNIGEFWRTWHISLSSWLRDYLYVPLGGNRGGTWKMYRNLMLTMLIGGLWHGPAWTFVIWGGLHGTFLIVHRIWAQRHPAPPRTDHRVHWRQDLVPIFITFQAVCFAWVFFRASSVSEAAHYLEGILTLRPGGVAANTVVLLAYAFTVTLLIDVYQRSAGVHAAILRLSAVNRGFVYGFFIVAILVFSGGTPVPFIYFQF